MGVKICPNCNGKVADTRNTCPHCNYEFDAKKVCPACGEEIDANLTECPVCGYNFNEGAQDKKIESSILDIKCPSCGSFDINKVGNDDYQCKNCNSFFKVNDGKPTIINKTIVNQNFYKNSAANGKRTYTKLTADQDKKQFIGECYYYLVKSSNIPNDIFDEATFGEVEEKTLQVIVCRGLADINYSRTLAVTKETYRTVYDGNGVAHTVTDYHVEKQIDNGRIYKEGVNYRIRDTNGDNRLLLVSSSKKSEDAGNKYMKEILGKGNSLLQYHQTLNSTQYFIKDSIKDELFEGGEKEEIDEIFSKESLENLKDVLMKDIYADNEPVNTDSNVRVEDTKINGTVTDFVYEVYDVPFYMMKITYKGATNYLASPAVNYLKPSMLQVFNFELTQDEQKYDAVVHKAAKSIARTKSITAYIIMTLIAAAWILIMITAMKQDLGSKKGLIVSIIAAGIQVGFLVLFIIRKCLFLNMLEKQRVEYANYLSARAVNGFFNAMKKAGIEVEKPNIEPGRNTYKKTKRTLLISRLLTISSFIIVIGLMILSIIFCILENKF